MSGRIIAIARPPEDSAEIAEAVRAAGFTPLVEPVLSIEALDAAPPESGAGRSLIFTSANGVRAYAGRTADRRQPVYAVGPNTADEARRAGFGEISAAAGTADDLVDILLKNCAKDGEPPLYVRGAEISKDLRKIVGAQGLRMDEFVAYRSVPAQALSLPLLRAVDAKALAGIMFFSVRGAGVFRDLLEQYGRAARMRTTKALCISEAVLQSVSVLPFGGSLVAGTPDRHGMIKLLEHVKVSER